MAPSDRRLPGADAPLPSTDDLATLVDGDWYLDEYPDVRRAGVDPLAHYINNGAAEGRDPNPFFSTAWYRTQYPDVAASGMPPILHYIASGAAELRNPHPRFDAAFYADRHPEAAANPMLFHLHVGRARGFPTEKIVVVADYMPLGAASPLRPLAPPAGVAVSIVVPVYRGLEQTQRCLYSLLRDDARLTGDIIVVDDHSPEPALSEWLDRLAETGRIRLLRNPRNLGFVASVNRGMREAGRHDVVLLNADTEVPRGWLPRLAAQAYAAPRIASVSPFSNRATICSYPAIAGSELAFDLRLDVLDDAARRANAGRSVNVPTTVGFCMYIRRAALDEVGGFDEKAFGRGYGEENDFCLRASARGWLHRLACDIFVYHEGEVSFGTDAPELAQAWKVLGKRYPHYARDVARHVQLDPAGPARFALTLALFRRSGLPCVLMVAHHLGGGVRRHITGLVARLKGTANVLLLEASARGVALSVPALPGHPTFAIAADRIADLETFLAAVPVTRAHIHHTMALGLDLRDLLHRLKLRFDVTLHDYFGICPQVNLLPWLDGHYCGEPGPAVCNACIAERSSHGAREILSWRRGQAWLFLEAERVLCPSVDARDRLLRFVPSARAVAVEHDPVPAGSWPMRKPPVLRPGMPLRIVVIGVLAAQKGAPAVIALAETADPATFAVQLIGYPEHPLPERAAARIAVTGEYREADLPALIATARPHVVWFPAQWPETYSYTLSAAIEAGLPIVASRIGAFAERLAGRPLTWLADPDSATADWAATFGAVRATLQAAPKPPRAARPVVADFYGASYAAPLGTPLATPLATPLDARSVASGPIDLRRPGRLSVVVIPETFDNGAPTPCAYIRLLQPLDHPLIGDAIDLVMADAASALAYRADIIATQRYAMPDLQAAERLSAHCARHGITLLYDLDDDLLNIPPEHPEHAELAPKATVVAHMLGAADAVWVSTEPLRAALAGEGYAATLVANALDERIWSAFAPPIRRLPVGPLRILYMGTATHDADFALVEPALQRLVEAGGGRIAFEMIGISAQAGMPAWIDRVTPSVNAMASYPGFVNWITQQRRWDIGIAPLVDSAFNRCKSALKTMDYAALGLPVLASDIPVFAGSLADGPGGMLVANTPQSWHAALALVANDPRRRIAMAEGARAALGTDHTLAAQAPARRAAWHALTAKRTAAAAAPVRRRNTGALA